MKMIKKDLKRKQEIDIEIYLKKQKILREYGRNRHHNGI